MNTLDYIVDKFKLKINGPGPVDIPNAGRKDLAELLPELDFKRGVEVGIADGQYSQILAEANPQMKFYGVDPWVPYIGYSDYTEKPVLEALRDQARKRMTAASNYQFIEEFSMDAVKQFQDESVDFVYIDANHEDPFITQDINEWSKKVRSGGIIAGHDFISFRSKGVKMDWKVKDAVLIYVASNNIDNFFIWGLSAKVPGMARDNIRSWMIVKP